MRNWISALILTMVATQALAQAPAAVVELANVVQRPGSATLSLPGTVISRHDAMISSELEGRLTWVAEVGDEVRAGQPLAVIDDHLLQLELRNREAQIARIQADIDYNRRQARRLQKLAEQNNMAQSELDEVESQLAMLEQDQNIARIELDRTRFDLERSSVKAPFNGVVAARERTPGEHTSPGEYLVRLVNTQELEVSVNAPLKIARFSAVGDVVTVSANGQEQLVPIRGVVPVGDSASRMMELRLQLLTGNWFIGEAVTVELSEGPGTPALAVPRDALVLRDNQVYVYTLSEDNRAIKVPVITGAGRGSHIAIEAELELGAPVIVRGAERLREGQTVKVLQHHLATG
ncbi:MAG: efflux RND transporter periplasmic adaptor subunit [Pseudomonadota bacterium]